MTKLSTSSHWTRRTFMTATVAALAATRLSAEQPTGSHVYIGSTTKLPADGIHVATWNPDAGTLSDVRLAFECLAPSFLAVSPDKKTLFAGHSSQSKIGGLSSFHIEPSGDLKLITTLNIEHADFVHLAVDHTGTCVIAPNYGAGTINSCSVTQDGRLADLVHDIKLTGHGPIASRQTAPHAHGVAISPNNRFVYISDLGTDRILIYKLNTATAELTPADPAVFTMPPGSGPRHLAFHPNGKWAYSVNELDSTLTFFTWNPATGALTSVAAVPTMLPNGDVATNRAGEIAFDRAGQFLYSCNRGAAEELLTYSIAADGRLKLIGRIPTGAKEARHFIVTPDDGHLLVARQFGNDVAVFTRDRKTGLLSATENRYPMDGASCVLFA
ncbi:lactonase family protein [Granulicella arctica]|uniref:lactonase family protein n=1 Tax=Granulicella arctica TaxID=940613 RepID=UPI0021DFE5A3|nr:lactonase family protein [Granulicella arctica]